jgi:hypothetical protein
MDCASFDIGVLLQCGRMLLRERRSRKKVSAAAGRLARENVRGARGLGLPRGEHTLTVLDDLT